MEEESKPKLPPSFEKCTPLGDAGIGGGHQAGPITRNPYLNYMRHKRQTGSWLSVSALGRQAAQEWRQMSDVDRYPFVKQAAKAPRNRRPHRERARARALKPLFQTIIKHE